MGQRHSGPSVEEAALTGVSKEVFMRLATLVRECLERRKVKQPKHGVYMLGPGCVSHTICVHGTNVVTVSKINRMHMLSSLFKDMETTQAYATLDWGKYWNVKMDEQESPALV
ncbi:ORF71 [Ranid herpesvirus 1]|uniref:ORF71 n=1 Tax=Ranid herpesvirus 1 TaxID=85655 RepID=Q14VP1_9VIRU|nr:ORF71 [Ranid herpesvirus 1]ABG25816.1 ORF71 [Ranid herpesvirus 1]